MKKTKFSDKTQEIIDRLEISSSSIPYLNKPRVEKAIQDHLCQLGLPSMPIEWALDGRSGYLAAESTALSAARSAAWSTAESAAWSAALSTARSTALSAARSAARSAAWSTALSAARSAAWSTAESAAWSAALSAARSAAWSAAWFQYPKSKAHIAYASVWLPFVDAHEAGLWIFWITEKKVICVPRPAMITKGDVLHCVDGPAVQWPSGDKYYFIEGRQIPTKLVPDLATKDQVQAILDLYSKGVTFT